MMKMTKRLFQYLFFSLFIVSLFTSCEGRRDIVADLPEKEANEILVFLAAKGIDADKKQQAATTGAADTQTLWTITVPPSQATEALSILNQHGLPRRASPSLLSLFQKSGLVSSAQEEKIRYQEGLSEQIASTIRKIDGVIDAVVQISFPDEDPLAQKQEEVRASVYIKHQGVLDDPNTQLIPKIKRLVSGSVVGLDVDNVVVIPDRARFLDTYLGPGDGFAERERAYERIWTIVVAKDSAKSFRVLFSLLIAAIVLLAAFISWVIWKLYPLIAQSGGLKSLFTHTKPLELSKPPEKEKEEAVEEEEE